MTLLKIFPCSVLEVIGSVFVSPHRLSIRCDSRPLPSKILSVNLRTNNGNSSKFTPYGRVTSVTPWYSPVLPSEVALGQLSAHCPGFQTFGSLTGKHVGGGSLISLKPVLEDASHTSFTPAYTFFLSTSLRVAPISHKGFLLSCSNVNLTSYTISTWIRRGSPCVLGEFFARLAAPRFATFNLTGRNHPAVHDFR